MGYKRSVIADTIHGNIELTSFEKRIISHVTFNRLHDVYQNSTVYMTFPCNRTKRFEHSLGTMKLCSDIFSSAINNSEAKICKEFLSFYEKKIKNILIHIKKKKYKTYESYIGGRANKIDVKSLPLIQENEAPFLSPSRESYEYYTVYFILIEAIRISALLHDIGHPPYSHVTEFALKNIRNKYKDSKATERIEEYNDIMDEFFDQSEKKLHEKMGDTIVKIILEDSIDQITEEDANSKPDFFNKQVIKILVKEVVEKILSNDASFTSLHKIVDGTLDGDRLDYVTRDAINSGLDKGKIEYGRLCNSMVITKYEGAYWICPDIKALNTIEDYLERRWSVYKNIIYHHRVVKTDYLLQSVIEEISAAYLEHNIEGEQELNTADLLPFDISGLWKALRASTNVDSSYAISQWDDAWLITVLKKHYFRDYINNDKNIKLTKQLQELLTNKKHYFSVIKRLEDFLVIDNAISINLEKCSDSLNYKINELKKLSKKCNMKYVETITIDPFLNNIDKILKLSKAINDNQNFQGLIFSSIRKSYSILFEGQVTLESFLNNIIHNSTGILPVHAVEDVFIVIKDYDIGVKKTLLVYNEKQGKALSIHEVSSIARLLDLSYDTFPQFFLYILKTEDYKDRFIDIKAFLEQIGKEIALKFSESCMELIDKNIDKYNSLIIERGRM